MADARKTKTTRSNRETATTALGPGMHPGHIEMTMTQGALGSEANERLYRVRLASGKHVTARLESAVAPDFAEECLRDNRTVVLVDGPEGPRIAGALQVARTIEKDEKGIIALEAKHLRLSAKSSIVVEVPNGSLSFDSGGALRIEGDKLVIDMAALVQIFSARVELP